MKRNLIEKLIDWKQSGWIKPLFLSGMRGCGKTYLALDFAKSFYEGALYLNFEHKSEREAALLSVVGRMRTLDDFAACICRLFDVPAEYLDHFLIVLDEAYEERGLWDFILSDAVLSVTDSGEGKVSGHFHILVISSRMPALPEHFAHVCLYPLQFDEFLAAAGQEWYSEVIRGHFKANRRIPGIVHEELLDRFEDYLCTGGMPAAVNEYLCFETTDNLPQIHQAYLGCILHDISRHYEEGEALRMRQVLEVIPTQLDKENQKFQYRLIRRGATRALYQGAIEELCCAQLIRLCIREGREELFKVFPADIGLLYALVEESERKGGRKVEEKMVEGKTSAKKIDAKKSDAWKIERIEKSPAWIKDGPAAVLPNEADNFDFLQTTQMPNRLEASNRLKPAGRFRSLLLECYVMQTLSACCHQPKFWESTSQARIDFLIDMDGGKIPVEVKTAGNTRSKSVSVYRASHEVPYSLKISGRNFDFSNQIRTIPYYSVFCL